MTQEDKELLLKDICARLPYGLKVKCEKYPFPVTVLYAGNINEVKFKETGGIECIYTIKPYLFPLSSMTEEQKRELLELTGYEPRCEESCAFDSWGFYVNIVGEYKYEDGKESIILYPDDIGIDWCNKNHFDHRGLIPKGIALDATGLNIY